jgi:hypothetical protein
VEWTGDSALEFHTTLWYPGTGDDDAIFINGAIVRYDFAQKRMEYEITDEKLLPL